MCSSEFFPSSYQVLLSLGGGQSLIIVILVVQAGFFAIVVLLADNLYLVFINVLLGVIYDLFLIGVFYQVGYELLKDWVFDYLFFLLGSREKNFTDVCIVVISADGKREGIVESKEIP